MHYPVRGYDLHIKKSIPLIIQLAKWEQHPSAEPNYTAEDAEQAKQCFIIVNEKGKMRLTRNIITGLPGAEEGDGFTLCTGSYGVRADNDLAAMIKSFGSCIPAFDHGHQS